MELVAEVQPIDQPTTVERKLIVFARGLDDKLKPNDVYQGSTLRYVSGILPNGTIVKGIPTNEEKLIPAFAQVLGMSTISPDWEHTVKNYWIEWKMLLPFATYKDGKFEGALELDAGYQIIGGLIYPNDIQSYIIYNLMSQDSKVAYDIADWPYRENFEYFCINMEDQAARHKLEVNAQSQLFITIAKLLQDNDEDKAKFILCQLISDDTAINIMEYDEVEWKGRLQTEATKNPVRFNEVLGMKDLAGQAKVKVYINAGIITQLGNTFYYRDEPIGNSELDVRKYMKSPDNTNIVNKWEQQLKEYRLGAIS